MVHINGTTGLNPPLVLAPELDLMVLVIGITGKQIVMASRTFPLVVAVGVVEREEGVTTTITTTMAEVTATMVATMEAVETNTADMEMVTGMTGIHLA